MNTNSIRMQANRIESTWFGAMQGNLAS